MGGGRCELASLSKQAGEVPGEEGGRGTLECADCQLNSRQIAEGGLGSESGGAARATLDCPRGAH